MAEDAGADAHSGEQLEEVEEVGLLLVHALERRGREGEPVAVGLHEFFDRVPIDRTQAVGGEICGAIVVKDAFVFISGLQFPTESGQALAPIEARIDEVTVTFETTNLGGFALMCRTQGAFERLVYRSCRPGPTRGRCECGKGTARGVLETGWSRAGLGGFPERP